MGLGPYINMIHVNNLSQPQETKTKIAAIE